MVNDFYKSARKHSFVISYERADLKRTGLISSQRRHNERDGVSNHRRLECFLNRSFRRSAQKTSKLRVTGGDRWIPLTKGQ